MKQTENLYGLLTERREEILDKCREKMAQVVGSKSHTYVLDEGLPTLYEELIEVLRISLEDDSPLARHKFVSDTVTASASRQHAQESYRLGYTISQLVHGYGSICQGVTEFAHEVSAPISATEFSQLNLCLDVAIAQAASEYQRLTLESANQDEALRVGTLVHELRNYLSSAIMAHEIIQRGGVGASGATGSLLTYSHRKMKDIIDRTMADVRLSHDSNALPSRLHLLGLLSEVESAAQPEANAKGVSVQVEADPSLYIMADLHLMASAIANLVQNAIKFTRQGGRVWIRSFSDGLDAIIEIEDQCGGLPEGETEDLFKPWVRKGEQHTGMGLGLSIARRAIELSNGKLTARTLPGVGCVFQARIPVAATVRDLISVRS